jgi:hypothetical protein
MANGDVQPRVDSEGYSEKPQTIDEITRVQREASGMDESGMNLTIRDQPIFEDENQAKQAMDDMASTLRMVGSVRVILRMPINVDIARPANRDQTQCRDDTGSSRCSKHGIRSKPTCTRSRQPCPSFRA